MRFSDSVHQFVRDAAVRSTTREKYAQVLSLACDVLGGDTPQLAAGRLSELDSAAQARGLAPSSRRRLLTLTCAALRSAGVAATPPRVRDDRPDAVRALSGSDAAALHRALANVPPDHSEALLVMLGTGVRLSELLGLRAADFCRESGTLRVARSREGGALKSRRSSRLVDVPDSILSVLVRRAQGGGRMFTCICERSLRRSLARACRAAGVDPCRVHDLRHTRITQLLLSGAPVLYVSQQAGHASPAFTMARYGHLAVASPEEKRKWANAPT